MCSFLAIPAFPLSVPRVLCILGKSSMPGLYIPQVLQNPCLLRSMPSLLCEEAWHEWVFRLAQPWDIGLNVGITLNLPDQSASLAVSVCKVGAILLALKKVICQVLSMCANQAIISKSFSWQHLEWSSSSRESREVNILGGALRAWVSHWNSLMSSFSVFVIPRCKTWDFGVSDQSWAMLSCFPVWRFAHSLPCASVIVWVPDCI